MRIPGTFQQHQINPHIHENLHHLAEKESGFDMSLREILFDQVKILWGDYSVEKPTEMELKKSGEVIDMHFKLSGKTSLSCNDLQVTMSGNEHGLFYHSKFEGVLTLHPTNKATQSFVDISIPRKVFDELMLIDHSFIDAVYNTANYEKSKCTGNIRAITPLMHSVVGDLRSTAFSGKMKQLYYEAKLIELLLLQLQMFENNPVNKKTLFRPADIERVHEAKACIDADPESYHSISALSRSIGINQKKLKQGFKEIFGNTVFGYVRDLKLHQAKKLLLEGNLSVNKVAEYAGYANQQHFTTAFKKKYNILPSSLLCRPE